MADDAPSNGAATASGAAIAEPSVIAQPSAAEQQTTGWYYLDNQGQHVGPFTTEQLQAYHTSGYVPPETLVWREGRPEWQQLRAVEELAMATQPAGDGATTSTSGATAARQTVSAVEGARSATAGQAAASGQGADAKAAVLRAAPVHQDPLAAFKGEISAIEAETEAAEQPPSPAERSFVDDDGTAYEWDTTARRFVESGTAAPAAAPATSNAYDISDMTFTGDDEVQPPMPLATAEDDEDEDAVGGGPAGKGHKADKRKLEEAVEREQAKKAKAKEDADRRAAWFELKKNSSVYISGLPLDATEAELVKVFTKCGVIKLDDDRRPRVKVYRCALLDGVIQKHVHSASLPSFGTSPSAGSQNFTDSTVGGRTNEEPGAAAFVSQIKARGGLTKSTFRKGLSDGLGYLQEDEDETGKGDGLVTYLKEPSVDLALQILDGAPLRDGDSQPMSVTQAKFEQKGKDFVNKKRAPKKRKKKVLEKQEEQELGWGGFDDIAPATKTTVVLRHMFHPDEFEQDLTLREQLQDDVQGEADKMGKVEKVKVYNTNPQGVLTVKFREEDAALQCIQVMHGRFFGGRQIDASMWDGIEQFWVKPVKTATETEAEQQARLEKYAAELEAAEAPNLEPPATDPMAD